MGSDMYRERILDHYRNPQNYGELEDSSFSHTGENPSCGDTIHVTVRVDDEGVIEDIGFVGDGCAISIASASLVTDTLQGEHVDQIHEFDRDDVLELLEIDVSPMRVKCAMLAEKVIEAGYEDYVSSTESG